MLEQAEIQALHAQLPDKGYEKVNVGKKSIAAAVPLESSRADEVIEETRDQDCQMMTAILLFVSLSPAGSTFHSFHAGVFPFPVFYSSSCFFLTPYPLSDSLSISPNINCNQSKPSESLRWASRQRRWGEQRKQGHYQTSCW